MTINLPREEKEWRMKAMRELESTICVGCLLEKSTSTQQMLIADSGKPDEHALLVHP